MLGVVWGQKSLTGGRNVGNLGLELDLQNPPLNPRLKVLPDDTQDTDLTMILQIMKSTASEVNSDRDDAAGFRLCPQQW